MKAIYIYMLLFCFACVVSAPAWAADPEKLVGVRSAIVYDLDNDEILFEQNADQQIPPASLTKVMSMFLAMDYVKDGHLHMDSNVHISKAAAATGGSIMGIRANENLPLKKLLLGMAVSSGNDASYAIAETVGGSAENFVKMMNSRARKLGMDNTHFENPHGLPAKGQVTTARDMLTLARAYLRAYPEALQLHNTTLMEHRGYRTWNKNPLLGQYPGADGLKSGWIRASGYNLIFTAKKNSRRLLAVILGAPDTFIRGAEACRLLDAGFMACDNDISMADALDDIPYDDKRIDPLKTGREAGLLKVRKARKAPVFSRGPAGTLLPSPRSVQKAKTAQKAVKQKKVAAKKSSKSNPRIHQAGKHHAQRASRARKG